MAEVWVRFPLDAYSACREVWSSRQFWELKIVGSNPTRLTKTICALGRLAEVPGFQPGEASSILAGHFWFS